MATQIIALARYMVAAKNIPNIKEKMFNDSRLTFRRFISLVCVVSAPYH